MTETTTAAEARPLLAAEHKGWKVDYSGLISQVHRALRREPLLGELMRQLGGHLEELGRRWYAGDAAVVDPPPPKPTITLTVNGREWVLPEPLSETPKHDQLVFYISDDGTVRSCRWNNWAVLPTLYKEQRLHDTEADAQAWAEFDKWCRGGGV